MTVTQFNGPSLKIVRAKMNEVLSQMREIGIHAHTTSIKYEDRVASVKVEISVIGEDGNVVSREAIAYDQIAKVKKDLPERGCQFLRVGERYEITGWAIRSRKYPVLAKRTRDGKTFKFTMDAVLNAYPA